MQYDDYYEDTPSCRECLELENKYDKKMHELRGCLTDIVKLLYSDERLDIARLDDLLLYMMEELLEMAHNQMPDGQPTIERKKSQIYKFATELALNQRAI